MKAVVFDMDGVIFDSERLVIKVWQKLGEKHGFSHVEDVCHQALGTNKETSQKIFLEYYGEDFPYDTYAKESSQLYHATYDGRLPLKKGVKELLAYLKAHHYKIALASSTRRYTVTLQLRNAGIIEDFDAIICGDMVEHSKPHPQIYQTACQAIDMKPSEAYAIEDSYNGIRSAYNAGMHPIMVPDLMPPTAEMEEKADVILVDLIQVITYLEGHNEE